MKRAQGWLQAQRGSAVTSLEELPGGAGARGYWRVRFADGSRAVLMHAAPEDPAILPPALRGTDDEIPFVTLTAWLGAREVPVPELYAVDAEERWVLLEDLGDVHLCDLDPAERRTRLFEAITLLAHVHALHPDLPYARSFDADWVRFELGTFVEHALDERAGLELEPGLALLAREIAALPRSVCLRDYQSQNLMIDARGRLRVLDYQDALLAPAELDLAALLYDSYVEIDDPLREELLDAYASARGVETDRAAFALLVVQRKCKDFGRYRFMVERKGDARYAPYLARARDAVLAHLDALPEPVQQVLAAPLRTALGQAGA